MESLLSEYIELPILNAQTGEFDEYSPKMWAVRASTMMGLATLMLIINLRKEFSGLRYVSVLILAAILLTIIVINQKKYTNVIGCCITNSNVL